MILDAFTVAELKELAKAREIDVKGVSGKEALVHKIEKDFFHSANIFPHLRNLAPEARAILEYMGVVSTEVTVSEICTFLELRKLIRRSSYYDQETYWELIKEELILKGLVVIARKEEKGGIGTPKKKEEWNGYKLTIPPQFTSMIPLPELPAIELPPRGSGSFSYRDFARELLLHLLREKQTPIRSFGEGNRPGRGAEASPGKWMVSDEVFFENDIYPVAFHELLAKVAGKLVYGKLGISDRQGNLPQPDCWKTLFPLLEREISADKVGRQILYQLKRLKKDQWCEEKTLEAAVTEYGLLKKTADVTGYFSTVLLPSGFGQKAVSQGLRYYRLAPEIFSYLTEGAFPEFPEDEAESLERKGDQVTFQCPRANPATLWRMMSIGRARLEGEWLTFTLDRVRLARLHQAGIDPSPLFDSLKKLLPPSFTRQYAEFRSELGKNSLYFHYTPIQINDEALALFFQSQLPELVPLGGHFYLLESGKIGRFNALLKESGYMARVIPCKEEEEPR